MVNHKKKNIHLLGLSFEIRVETLRKSQNIEGGKNIKIVQNFNNIQIV